MAIDVQEYIDGNIVRVTEKVGEIPLCIYLGHDVSHELASAGMILALIGNEPGCVTAKKHSSSGCICNDFSGNEFVSK